MPKITGKTVYILGAGASFVTGAPLLNDFLVSANFLRNSKNDLIHKASFDNIFRWIDSLRSTAYYVDYNIDNLEHVFSLAEMMKQLGLPEGKELCSDLKWLILETLDELCRITLESPRGKDMHSHLAPNIIYSSFVKNITKLNNERKGINSNSFQYDSILTFNYDIMLDYALEYHKIAFTYGLQENKTGLKYLKLHGSTNWGKCKQCADCEIVPMVIKDHLSHRLEPNFEHEISLPIKVGTSFWPQVTCQHCKEMGVLEPVIIPPTWSKTIEHEQIKRVWKTAVQELQEASQIVIIGYSMPQTDTFFQYLLTLGLQKNENLNRIVVANTDTTDSFKTRYKNVFARSLFERKKLVFLSDKDGNSPVEFRHFIDHYMPNDFISTF
jgi:hypothetical protein